MVDQASELVDKAIDLEPKILFDTAENTKQKIIDVKKKLEDEVMTSCNLINVLFTVQLWRLLILYLFLLFNYQAVSSEDIKTLQDAMEILANEKKSLQLEKEELDELKEEMSEYKEVRKYTHEMS